MTKPKFDVYSPLPGSDDAPVITAEQMSRFLYNHIGAADGKQIADAINGSNTPDFYGALQVTYVEPQKVFHGFTIGQTIYANNPGGYRMFAVSTVHDDQTGCKRWDTPHIAIRGSEGSRGIVPVTDFSATKPVTSVHGFDIGATVYSKRNSAWTGPMIVAPESEQDSDASWEWVTCIHPIFKSGGFPANELTTDVTESKGYEPPKPAFLPIERPVRIEDVERGDVLMFTSNEQWASTEGAPHDGFPALGSEVVVNFVQQNRPFLNYVCTTGRGERVESQFCSPDMFSFVRRPFKVGEVVVCPEYKEGSAWHGNMLVKRVTGYGTILCTTRNGTEGGFTADQLKRVL